VAFVAAAKVGEIAPGRGKVVRAGDREIGLFRVGESYCAIENTCPHRGGPLGEGDLDGTVVTCPWHGWTFDVATGCSPVNPAAKVRTFPVEVVGDEVRVAVD
jgi:nitrite reductase (NADH) small subunit/3-phenylpropionate/trans-cinnamate dioxygenase ferredoxin subunit